MRVAVLGGGVIGVTSAWYLAQAGHEVEVIERQSGPALETSFANAGQISPGLASPWAAPGIPLKALRWMASARSPLVFRPRADPAQYAWLARFLRNCNLDSYLRNKACMVRLAEYSRDRLRDLRHLTGIAYDGQQLGLLQVFRTQRDMDAAAHDAAVLERLGVPYGFLDRAACLAQEPGLAQARVAIAGGLLLPHDETGDARMFTERLAALAAARGVTFRYDTRILRLRAAADQLTGVETDRGEVVADAYVLALGSHSPLLLRPLGIRLPVYPLKGYSLTLPVTDARAAPRSTVLDETNKIGITRLGDRIRVGGTAELSGYSADVPASRRATLFAALTDLFPDAGDRSAAVAWTGLRPMTPDGPPVIGATPLKNLFLNTGHGTLGWTMACGSGALVADLVSGRTPNIDHGGLDLARFRVVTASPNR